MQQNNMWFCCTARDSMSTNHVARYSSVTRHYIIHMSQWACHVTNIELQYHAVCSAVETNWYRMCSDWSADLTHPHSELNVAGLYETRWYWNEMYWIISVQQYVSVDHFINTVHAIQPCAKPVYSSSWPSRPDGVRVVVKPWYCCNLIDSSRPRPHWLDATPPVSSQCGCGLELSIKLQQYQGFTATAKLRWMVTDRHTAVLSCPEWIQQDMYTRNFRLCWHSCENISVLGVSHWYLHQQQQQQQNTRPRLTTATV